MRSRKSSNTDEENLALALRLSQLSSNAFDEHVSQLRPSESALAEFAFRPTTPPNDGKHSPEMAADVLPESVDAPEKRVDQLHSYEPTPPGKDACQPTPPDDEDDDDDDDDDDGGDGDGNGDDDSDDDDDDDDDDGDLELVLRLSKLPAGVFDEQVGELNQRSGSRMAGGSLASLLTAIPEVWMLLSPHQN